MNKLNDEIGILSSLNWSSPLLFICFVGTNSCDSFVNLTKHLTHSISQKWNVFPVSVVGHLIAY